MAARARRGARSACDDRIIGGIVPRTRERRRRPSRIHRADEGAQRAHAAGIMAAFRPGRPWVVPHATFVTAPAPGSWRSAPCPLFEDLDGELSSHRPLLQRRDPRPLIGLILVVGVVLAAVSGSPWPQPARDRPQPLPADRGDRPGRADPRALHDRVPDRGRDLLRGRGPDRLDHPPLPAQADRRRAPAPDPRQQPRRDRVDARPDAHRRVPVRDLVADAQHGRHRRARQPDVKIRAVAGQFQWQFEYLADATATNAVASTPSSCRPATAAAWTSRPAGPSSSTCPASTSSTPSTSRSSCSSATSSRAGPTSSSSTWTPRRRPDVPRPVRRAVRHRPPDHAVRGPSR